MLVTYYAVIYIPVVLARVMSSEKLKMPFQNPPKKSRYKNSCIAPKLVDQTGRPSVGSDKYSLDYLINIASGL